MGNAFHRAFAAGILASATALLACSTYTSSESPEPLPSDAGSGNSDGGSTSGSGSSSSSSGAPEKNSLPLPNASFLSGTRLKARFYKVGDVRSFKGFFDNELKQNCAFSRDSDGELRCFPDGTTLGTLFTDEACTQAAGFADSCSASTTGYLYDPTTCRNTVFETQVTVSSNLFSKGGTSCTRTNVSKDSSIITPTGPALPPSRFVRGVLERETFGVLGRSIIRGEDGSATLVGAVDVALDVPCGSRFGYGRAVCEPRVDVYGPYFTEKDCKGETGFLQPGTLCRTPKIGQMTDPTTCASRFFFLGAGRAAAEVVSFAATNGCFGTGPVGGTFFPSGSEVTTFRPVVFRNVGSGDAKLVHVTDGGTNVLQATQLYDEKRGISCTPQQDENGVLRCAPAYFSSEVYLDAICTKPAFVTSRDKCSEPPKYFAAALPGACNKRARVFAVGKKVTNNELTYIVYSKQGVSCTQQNYSNSDVYEVSAVPSTELPSLDEGQDP
jgi:hypothetical protein